MPFAKGQSGNPAGRPKGARSKVSRRVQFAVERAGLTPLEFLLLCMRDAAIPIETRIECAARAAPYVHRKMPVAFEHAGGTPSPDAPTLASTEVGERLKYADALMRRLGLHACVLTRPETTKNKSLPTDDAPLGDREIRPAP